MKLALPVVALILLAACGSSATDTGPDRYNFAVVDGANQISTAGDATLAKRVTSQLTRDPNGTFAARVFDFLAPTIAYAQGLVLSGTPVAGAIVCGREAKLGEPQVIPLCAFTLADGKAANAVQPGTKAGKFNILFTAQVPAAEPVKDSTTVTVQAGGVAKNWTFVTGVSFPNWDAGRGYPADVLFDQYMNPVSYRMLPSAYAHALGDTLGTAAARTLAVDSAGTGTIQIITAQGVYATGRIVTYINLETPSAPRTVTLDFPNGPASSPCPCP